MNTRLINPGVWELNLSHIKLSTSQQNSYFSDTFFGTITYPFDFNVSNFTPEFIYHHNRFNFHKVYDNLLLERNGKIEECKLILLEAEGKNVSFQLVVGFDNFPNFDKKLSELPLEKFDLPSGTDLYQHANFLVDKTYPETNYTFPAVHTDEVDTSNSLFAYFKGTYNLYQNSSFLKNQIDSGNNNQILNYNLLEPAVSLFYLLKTGFADAGYTLEGNVLEDPVLKNLWLFKGNTYSSETYPGPVEWLVTKLDSHVSGPYYRSTQEIPFVGRFRIKGMSYILGWGIIFRIKDLSTGQVVWEPQTSGNTEPVDFTINTSKDTVLEFYGSDPGAGFTVNKILELIIIPETIFNEDGSVYNPNLNFPKIDLTQCVPDITFGDLIKAFKNTVNFDIDRDSRIIKMNFIEKEIRDLSNVTDFRMYEVMAPNITFNEGNSFLLKYEYENEKYPLEQVYIDKSGAVTSDFQKMENTNEIVSPVIPLPMLLRNSLNSAKVVGDGTSDIQVLLYSGLKDKKNESLDNTPLLWPQLYEAYWREWLEFRIFSDTFKWKFNVPKEEMKNLTVKSKIYAYNRVHFIQKLSREDLSQVSEEIELETSSE